MLVSFAVTNFRSFEHEATLSLVATRERRHGDRVLVGPIGRKILPVAALFGENASGKSNLYRAIRFLQRLMVRPHGSPDVKIPLEQFKLDGGEGESTRTRFSIEILPCDTVYRLTVAVDQHGIAEEKLEEVRNSRRIPIYSRERAPGAGVTIWDIGHLQRRSAADRDLIAFKSRDVWDNQLLLAVLRGKGIAIIDEVNSWFGAQLALMVPDSTLKLLEYSLPTREGLLEFCNQMLQFAGTGIHALQPEAIAWGEFPLAEDVKEDLRLKLQEGQSTLVRSSDGRRYTVARREGHLTAARLHTVHQTRTGRLVRFGLESESEGVQRFLDLLPAFFELITPGSSKVFVIDEFDRGLHPLLAHRIVAAFLAGVRPENRKQLIFTTHDTNLLDQDLLRRDEIWFVQRNPTGESKLLSLANVAGIRYDRDIRKAYLTGEFGGVPQFGGAFLPPASPGTPAAENEIK